MIVKDTGGASFAPHPVGQYPAVFLDGVDVGGVEKAERPKFRARLVFYCGQQAQHEVEGTVETYPMLVFTTFNQTLSENGRLRPFLESWRGAAFTVEQLKGFDLDHLLGVPAFLQILHNDTGEHANVQTIMPLPKEMAAPPAPTDYQRVQAREGYAGPAPHPDMSPPAPQAASFPAAPTGVGAQGPDPSWPAQPPVQAPAQKEPDDDLPF